MANRIHNRDEHGEEYKLTAEFAFYIIVTNTGRNILYERQIKLKLPTCSKTMACMHRHYAASR